MGTEAPANGGPPEGAAAEPPVVVRRVESENASLLRDMVETFEELQMVLRCCERLVSELGPGLPPDPVVVEGVWTMALLSYARCFAQRGTAAALGEDELTTVQPDSDVLEWHKVLLRLREHYGDPTNSPRERFTVAVTQDADGAASGVAITSVKQPLVDEVTVRQLGAISYALSNLVNDRIEAQQALVSGELETVSREDLEKLDQLDVAPVSTGA